MVWKSHHMDVNTMFLNGVIEEEGMMDYKSMATPMMKNMKKLSNSASDSDLVDPTMYK
jgi:hypothetical protein